MKNVFIGIRYRILKSIRSVSCIVFALMMVVCAAAATPNPVFAAGYTDIEGHWAEKIINRVTDLGLFVGGGNNHFFPQRETTRAEFITVMTRALNPEVDNTSNETSYWAFKYLKFAKEKGYIPADYDISEEYCSQTMSRLEMIRLLALMIEKLEVPHDVTPPDLTDTDGLDEADIKIIHFVMTTGVIKGHNNQVMPYKTASRAELATVILNMHDKAPENNNSGNNSGNNGSSNNNPAFGKTGTADAGFGLGETFNDSAAFVSYRVNAQLTWKIIKNPETKVFAFVIVNNSNEIIARSAASLPEGRISKIESFPYIEYNVADRTFWDYREWDKKVGEDGSVVLMEINPKYKKELDTAPASEKEMEGYERVAEYITNVFRVKKGASVLKHHPELYKFSKSFSQAMDKGNFFSHDMPDGTSFVDRIEASGLSFHSVAENIAYGFPEPVHLVHEWINSPAHRKNILSDFDYVSVGIVASKYKSVIATQNFLLSK